MSRRLFEICASRSFCLRSALFPSGSLGVGTPAPPSPDEKITRPETKIDFGRKIQATSKQLIVLVGATGSGKTDLSIRLARRFGRDGKPAPILSTDSRQVYRGMAIGTAQPTQEQLQQVEHHFIAELDLNQHFSCGEFETAALDRLQRLFGEHDTVIAVGGSGLYVRALCEGMDELPEVDPPLRASLDERLAAEGLEALAAQLAELDPEYHAQVDHHNPARVVRALEVCLQTGRPYSSFRTGVPRRRPFEIVKIGIEMDRAVLYRRIDGRVEQMMADGLEAEARALWTTAGRQNSGVNNALRTIGYAELFDYFEGHGTLEEAVALIKRNSRRYAKRQTTWFRRDPQITWVPHDVDPDSLPCLAGTH